MTEMCDWINRATRLLHELVQSLSESVEAWHKFRCGTFSHISDLSDSSRQLLHTAQLEFDKLEIYLGKLNRLNERCDLVAQKVQFHYGVTSMPTDSQS